MAKQLKEHIATLQDILQTVKKRKSDRSITPAIDISKIINPDAEFRIALRIVNDLIKQNLPFKTTVDLDDANKLDVNITDAVVLTGSGNSLHLRINDAELRFRRNKIDFGVKSKDFEITITSGITKTGNGIFLVAFGQVSKFSLKYFPSAMNSGIKEILNLVIPFPLVTINVKEYLDVNTEIPAGVVPLKINKELEDVSLVVDGGSIHVKVKYSPI